MSKAPGRERLLALSRGVVLAPVVVLAVFPQRGEGGGRVCTSISPVGRGVLLVVERCPMGVVLGI